jgi:RNA polymerase sigma-70 factor (ECF subfamily)
MSEHDESTLLDRSLNGDAAAFGCLVHVHEGVVYNLALRMLGNREDALDVAQVVFTKVWLKLATFDRRNKLFSWIYRIALNETLNHRRRRRAHEPLEETLRSPEAGPAERQETDERSRILQEALMEIRPAERELLILHHMLGFSHRDIGELHALPEKTVKSRLFNARQRLEACLRRRGLGTP